MDGWALFTAIGLLAVFAGLSWLVRRGVPGVPQAEGDLRLLQRVPLGRGAEVLVVALGERRLLLAHDAAGVRLLTALDDGLAEAPTFEGAPAEPTP
ncbi:MAG: flagellar biosynthetic protein FliO [Myxococcales bacterium]|nr:flagellar biosynthetic protein FliO [Myxococcales bacterium]MCB9522750.1 flagellar biosynthetic protein FliO [Myxococcales bacterium]